MHLLTYDFNDVAQTAGGNGNEIVACFVQGLLDTV